MVENKFIKGSLEKGTSNKTEITNILNNHFATVGTKLAQKLPASNKPFDCYLNEPAHKTFFFEPITSQEVESEIVLTPTNKSYGLYSCPTNVLKLCKEILSEPLSEIFNLSVQLGEFPDKLMHAKIIPVYKSEDESDPSNYRPISLLSIYIRIFEKIMHAKLSAFIMKHNLLYQSQYGFRENHSTQHAILDIVQKILCHMDNKKYSCGIFFDLKKAFDTVNHNILLAKMHHYGFRGVAYDWLSSYLRNHTQTTSIGDCVSEKLATPCGVPQGSVLGPLLFLIYINDIHACSKLLDFYLFADDTNLLYANKSLRVLERIVIDELKKVASWLLANKLTLNIKKSNYVIFHTHQKKLNYNVKITMFDSMTNKFISLESKEYIKYLGVLIDSRLSWKHHINFISSKISKTIGIISKIRHFGPRHIMIKIYQSLIHPYISYGVCAWGQSVKTNLKKLLVLQKRVIRLIHFASNREHAVPYFVQSRILPLDSLFFQQIAYLMHDVDNHIAPKNIVTLFKKVHAKCPLI